MNQNRRAFTFTEITIGLAIAVVLASVAWGFFSGFLRISGKGSQTTDSLSKMSIAFAWLRRDLSSVIIHEPIIDDEGKKHNIDIQRKFNKDGTLRELQFYIVFDVIKELAKPVIGVIKYELIPAENNLYSLQRSLLRPNKTVIRRKVFLKGKISKLDIQFYKNSELGEPVLIKNPNLSLLDGNMPESMVVQIEHQGTSRVKAAIAINSPYAGERNHDNYYANWLLQNIPYSSSAPSHQPRYVKKKAINIKGYGTAISTWEEDEEE